jgi:CheY-like chemotaxis protein
MLGPLVREGDVVRVDGSLGVHGRSGFELLEDQLDGLSSWHRDMRRWIQAAESAHDTREQRLDLRRRMEALRRAEAALLARADDSIEGSVELLRQAPARSLLAHRSEWMRHKLALGLEEVGMTVLAEVDNGADALGVSVFEQPDLLIVEDRLPSMTGLEVVRSVRQLAPKTMVVAQVEDDSDSARMLDAGAEAVFDRRIPPHLVVEQVIEQFRLRAERPLPTSA